MTTVIAIYGAIVATFAVLVTVWQFYVSGPRLRAEANLREHFLSEGEEDSGNRVLILKVWNTGRNPIKVDFDGLTIRSPSGIETYVPLELIGPALPIWIPGNSGEEWWDEMQIIDSLEQPIEANEVWVELKEAGHRIRKVKVPQSQLRRIMDPIVLGEPRFVDLGEPDDNQSQRGAGEISA
jgi:hypothetical protein